MWWGEACCSTTMVLLDAWWNASTLREIVCDSGGVIISVLGQCGAVHWDGGHGLISATIKVVICVWNLVSLMQAEVEDLRNQEKKLDESIRYFCGPMCGLYDVVHVHPVPDRLEPWRGAVCDSARCGDIVVLQWNAGAVKELKWRWTQQTVRAFRVCWVWWTFEVEAVCFLAANGGFLLVYFSAYRWVLFRCSSLNMVWLIEFMERAVVCCADGCM